MKLQDFAKDVAKAEGITQKKAKAVIITVFEKISETMASKDQILIPNFARFGTKTKKARIGTNLSTNEKVSIPAKVGIKISPTKKLKELVEKELK